MSTTPLKVTPEQAAAVDKVGKFIVRFGMTVPAILALESVRPLSYVGSQFMHLLSPSIGAFLTVPEWDAMAHLLEDRRRLEGELADEIREIRLESSNDKEVPNNDISKQNQIENPNVFILTEKIGSEQGSSG